MKPWILLFRLFCLNYFIKPTFVACYDTCSNYLLMYYVTKLKIETWPYLFLNRRLIENYSFLFISVSLYIYIFSLNGLILNSVSCVCISAVRIVLNVLASHKWFNCCYIVRSLFFGAFLICLIPGVSIV